MRRPEKGKPVRPARAKRTSPARKPRTVRKAAASVVEQASAPSDVPEAGTPEAVSSDGPAPEPAQLPLPEAAPLRAEEPGANGYGGGGASGTNEPARGAEPERRDGRLERRILEELIYERVRLTVDLCELMAFEADLAASISRALAACARSPEERSDLTLDLLQRAWDRLTDDVLGEIADNEGREAAGAGRQGAA